MKHKERKLMYATEINGQYGHNGVIDIEENKIICLCPEEQAEEIIKWYKAAMLPQTLNDMMGDIPTIYTNIQVVKELLYQANIVHEAIDSISNSDNSLDFNDKDYALKESEKLKGSISGFYKLLKLAPNSQ